jgi:hypothetical protein
MRVEDTGKSEGCPVMGQIAVEAYANIAAPERGLTSGGSQVAREFVEPS